MPPVARRHIPNLEETPQTIYFIVKHQAGLGITTQELEMLLQVALYTYGGIHNPTVPIIHNITQKLGKTERQVMHWLRSLQRKQLIKIGTSWSPDLFKDTGYLHTFDLTPLLALIARAEGWIQDE